MKSRIFSSDSIKVNLKGQIWIPFLLAFGFFMAFPVASLLQISSWMDLAYTPGQIAILYSNLWKDGMVCTGMIVMLCAAFLNGVNGFWYLYSSRKVDFYHSLPQKRSSMFVKKVAMAFGYTIVPYFIMVFAAMCVGIAFGQFSFSIVKMAAAMTAVHILVYFMMYFGTVLVIVMTGNVFMGVLSLAGINLFAPVLGNALNLYQSQFYQNSLVNDFYQGWLSWISPACAAVKIVSACIGEIQIKVLLIYCVFLILLAAAAFAAYVCRPSEAAGKALVYGWSEIVIGYMMTVLSGLCIGIIFYMSNYGSGRQFWWIFGILTGTILMHGAIQVICRMDFRKFFSRIYWLGGALLTVAVISCVYKWDLTGFDRYVPPYEKLEDICIIFDGSTGDNMMSVLEKNEDGTYSVYSRTGTRQALEHFSVGLTGGIYESLVQASGNKKPAKDSMDYYNYNVNVRYAEKSGKEIFRRYHLTAPQMKALFENCYEEGNLTAQKYAFLDLDPSYIQAIRLGTLEGSWPQIYSKGKDEDELLNRLLEALKADVDEADTAVLMENPCAQLDLDYMGLPAQHNVGRMIPGKDTTESFNTNVYVYPGFQRTVALLKDLGYPVTMDEISVDDMVVNYYDPDNGWAVSADIKYSEKQKKELQKIMCCSSLLPAWAEYDNTINICIGDASYVLDEANLPDFIKEDQQKMKNGELELAQGGSLG